MLCKDKKPIIKKYKSIISDICTNVKKGSYTVEAAVIMGSAFFVISAVLYIASFTYGRACLTASAYEQAFTERIQAEYGLFGFSSIKRTFSFDESENLVSYTGRCYSAWGGYEEDLMIEAKVVKEKPVTFIRKWQAAGEIGR